MQPDEALVKILVEADKAYRVRAVADPGNGRARAEWLAAHLLDETGFNRLTNRDWQAAELAEALSALETAYERLAPRSHWAHYFAARLGD